MAAATSGEGLTRLGDLGARTELLHEARTLRARAALPEALAVLARLEALAPRFSRLYEERGHCLILQRDAPGAIAALEQAVRLNSALPSSWDMLAQLFRLSGDPTRADAAGRNALMLRQLPVEVVAAQSLLADGDLETAEAAIRQYLRKDQGNVGALRLLARIRMDSGALEEAERLLRDVLARAPDYHAARLDLAMALLQQQKHAQARGEAERLLRQEPENRAYLKQYAAACVGLGDHEPVIDIYARLLADASDGGAEAADLRLWRANALKVTGRTDEAIEDYRAALALREDNGVAWFSLANLKTYRFDESEVARMRVAESLPEIADMDRVYLCFALGKALEDRGDYAVSWHYYARGNDQRRATVCYRADAAEACAERLQQVFTAPFFAERAGWGLDDPAPIFVLGLPRAGSTLIEQILASHSAVEGTQELTEIGRYAAELCGADPACSLPVDPAAIARLTSAQVRALGERFIAETRVHRQLGRPLFIDKMPNNLWHVGLIHLILPRATIIDVRREPMASCFGMFKQLFGTVNQAFSYGIEDLARHYRTYLAVMRHWDAVLPGRVLRVHHEDVVGDLDSEVRRMLGHTGLPFEPACLAFHATQRSVRTPSSEQVRRPIDPASMTQWQRYAPWLGPLEAALGDARNRYRS